MKTQFSLIKLSIVALLLPFFTTLQAQLVKVSVSPENSNWLYRPNEKVKFRISVTKNSIPLENAKVYYSAGPEMMPASIKDSVILRNGLGLIDGGRLKEAGFLRCWASTYYEGKKYSGMGTAGFAPEEIKPTVKQPNDFKEFWENAKAEAAKIPMDARMRLLPERCTEKSNVYEVSIQNFRYGSRVYGILCVPKAPGKYPAVLKVPGAGVRPYNGEIAQADKGIITLEIGIHGIPVTMAPSVYEDIRNGALKLYPTYDLDNKDRYYYKRVYLGCVRSVDFLFSLPEFDGENLAVTGGSQGGALSIVTAALDSRVKSLAIFFPAMCDMTGYLHKRAGGWPHLFSASNLAINNTAQKIETSQYYDVVNFARELKVPGFYSWGYNDDTCPPTSMYAAYNVITAPKTLFIVEETGHWTYPEQITKAWDFLFKQIGK